MPWGLTHFHPSRRKSRRLGTPGFHHSGQSHFVPFCCSHRRRLFTTDASGRIFESALVESHPNVAKGATLGWGTPADRISTPLNPQNVSSLMTSFTECPGTSFTLPRWFHQPGESKDGVEDDGRLPPSWHDGSRSPAC